MVAEEGDDGRPLARLRPVDQPLQAVVGVGRAFGIGSSDSRAQPLIEASPGRHMSDLIQKSRCGGMSALSRILSIEIMPQTES